MFPTTGVGDVAMCPPVAALDLRIRYLMGASPRVPAMPSGEDHRTNPGSAAESNADTSRQWLAGAETGISEHA
jgi:hypothetical protein